MRWLSMRVSQTLRSGRGTFACLQKIWTFQKPNDATKDQFVVEWRGYVYPFRQLSYPCRDGDTLQRFAKPVPLFSMVTNILIAHKDAIHGLRLTQWNLVTLNPDHHEMYTAAITLRGSPLDNCFGFFNGTVQPIAWPGKNQLVVCSGYK